MVFWHLLLFVEYVDILPAIVVDAGVVAETKVKVFMKTIM